MVRPSGGWGNRRLSGKTDTVKTEESWTQSMLANAEPFIMPSDSGATKEFTDGEAGDFDRELLSITVLAVPDTSSLRQRARRSRPRLLLAPPLRHARPQHRRPVRDHDQLARVVRLEEDGSLPSGITS